VPGDSQMKRDIGPCDGNGQEVLDIYRSQFVMTKKNSSSSALAVNSVLKKGNTS